VHLNICSSQTLRKQPLFGCRQVAFLTPNAETRQAKREQADYVEKVLSTGGNSFEAQDQAQCNWFGVTDRFAQRPFTDDMYRQSLTDDAYIQADTPEKEFKKAGWGGLAVSQDNEKTFTRSFSPTWNTLAQFTQFVEKAKQKSKLFLAHMRGEGYDEPLPNNKNNNHPFSISDWHVAFTGSPMERENVIDRLMTNLIAWHTQDPSIPLPKSPVDTELFACYFAAKLKQITGKSTLKSVSNKDVVKVIQATFADVYPHEDPENPTITKNFVITDGDRLFVTSYRKNNTRRLFMKALHERESDGKKELLLALEKMQPELNKPLNWETIPHNSLAVFTLGKPGTPQQVTDQRVKLFP